MCRPKLRRDPEPEAPEIDPCDPASLSRERTIHNDHIDPLGRTTWLAQICLTDSNILAQLPQFLSLAHTFKQGSRSTDAIHVHAWHLDGRFSFRSRRDIP